MKTKLLNFLPAFVAMLIISFFNGQSPSSTENYIQTTTCLSADCIKKAVTVEYFDGLGRIKQVVDVKASPAGKDVVTHIEYDGFGRQVKDFLPVPQSNTLNGAIVPNPLSNATQPNIYGNERIFAEKKLENSPLDRLQEQRKVGNAWANKPIRYAYSANAANEIRKYVTTTSWVDDITQSILKVADDGGSVNGFYKEAMIYKNIITDEDNNVTYEYSNGEGQLLLIKKVLSATEAAETYYVYNEYNELAFIIPPKASDAIKNLPAGALIPDAILNDFCYQYKYDGKKLLAEKKLPNKGWEYFVYDKQERLTLTQDALLRTTNNNFQKRGWLFTKYDQFGRLVYTGFFEDTSTRKSLQTALDNLSANPYNNEARVSASFNNRGMEVYYTQNAFPTGNMTVLSVNYYDIYPPQAPGIPPTVLGQKTLPQTLDANNNASTKSFLTASYLKNIENNDWTRTYTYYDTRGNVIATKSKNHLGGYTNKDLLLDFTGEQVEKSITYHKRLNTDTEKIITELFSYDHQNRLLTHTHQVDNKPVELLTRNEYNELSQIKSKKVGGTDPAAPLQSIDYAYNIQGWLTKINNPQNLGSKLFAYELKFTNPSNTNLASPYYNGNIAEADWIAAGDNILKRYSYRYDAMGRLKSGIYTEPNSSLPENNFYNELLTYDLNGNVKTLKRNRNAAYVGAQLMDDLTYSYTGNRLDAVTDSSGNYFGYPETSGTPIMYDANGNMISQEDKNLLEIQYNFLNLPTYVKIKETAVRRDPFGFPSFTRFKNTSYLYRSDGSKLRKIHNYFSGRGQNDVTATTEYLDGFQYFNEKTGFLAGGTTNVLQFVPTSEGYFDFVQNKYFYQYKDQVGNVRLSFYKGAGGAATIDRATDYYPFGLEFGGNNSLNTVGSLSPNYTYSFQEQEKQQETGWYAFKWRNYDPTYVRFFGIDPLAEKYPSWGPYVFSGNRVIDARELEGLEPHVLFNTRESAARNFGKQYNGKSILKKREYMAFIYFKYVNGKKYYAYNTPVKGNAHGIPKNKINKHIPKNAALTAYIHTHGNEDTGYDDENFSGKVGQLGGDIGYAEGQQLDAFLVTPGGVLVYFDVSNGKATTLKYDMPSDPKSKNRQNKIDPELSPLPSEGDGPKPKAKRYPNPVEQDLDGIFKSIDNQKRDEVILIKQPQKYIR